VKPFLKGHKNDYRDAEAIAETVQRPTMRFVSIKTPEQMDLLALHRVRSRLVGQRTGVINQIRGFLLERGITVRQGPMPLRKVLPEILSSDSGALSPRKINLLGGLVADWRRLDERIDAVSAEIEALAKQDTSCQRLMSIPGVGPIISSAVVAAIGNGAGFKQGRDFAAWLGLIPKQESTGDRTILGKISKRGNKYVRTLFVQAAHVVLARRPSTPSPQHAGDRARQQACAHRLGCPRARSHLSAEDHHPCLTKARSGPPRGCPPPLSATVAHQIG
jgi:transposase